MEIVYRIEIKDKEDLTFKLSFDGKTYLYLPEVSDDLPEWTQLESNKCTNCPLRGESHCPAAVNIHDMVLKTKTNISHEEVKVYVKTDNRTYAKKTDLQSALFSLMGIVLSSSKCPHFFFLRPMGTFHMPFSNLEETMVRVIGFYFTQEYFKNKHRDVNEQVGLSLDGLEELYGELEIVNKGLASRIHSATSGDANKNAIVTLNLFVQMFQMAMGQDFSIIKKYFDPILVNS